MSAMILLFEIFKSEPIDRAHFLAVIAPWSRSSP
jgi:hypothetical protein